MRVTEGHHGGIEGRARAVWMRDRRDRIATTGFSRMSDRQGGRVGDWVAEERQDDHDVSFCPAGVVMPFWSDNNILFSGEPFRVALALAFTRTNAER